MERFKYELDAHLHLRNISKAFAKLLGGTPKELEGLRFDTLITRDCAPHFLETMLSAFRGKRVRSLRLQIIQKQRRKIHVDMSINPIEPDAQSAVQGVQGTLKALDEHVHC